MKADDEDPRRVRPRATSGRSTATRLGALAEAIEAPRLRLAVAVGAHQRSRARSDARRSRSRRPRTSRIKLGTSVQVLPGRSPALARQGVGDARRALGRARAPRLRARHRAPGRATGVRRRARRAGRRSSTKRSRSIRRLWSEDAVDHDGTHFHYEGMTVLPKPRSRSTCGSAARRPRSSGGSAGSATAGSRRSARPKTARRHACAIEDAAAPPAARSTTTTSARWCSTRTTSSPNGSSSCSLAQPGRRPDRPRRAAAGPRSARAVRALRRRRLLEARARAVHRAQATGTTSSRRRRSEVLPIQN